MDTTVDSDIQQPEVPGKRPRRLLVRLATVVLVLLLVAGVAIHTSFVRGRALSSAASWLSSHFDILLRADSLDYNLLTLRGNLTNLSLANRRTPDRPFFKAARVDFDVAWASVRGPVHLWSVEISRPRIVLAFNDDGTNNLPVLKGGSNKSGGGGVRIDRIVLRDADLSYDDRPHNLKVDLQQLRLTLGGVIPNDVTGRLTVGAPGSLSVGGWHTTLTRVATGFGFNRRGVRLDNTAIGMTEGDLAVQGPLSWGMDGAVGLSIGGQFDMARSLRALDIDLDVSGPVATSGTVSGTWQNLRVALDVRSTRMGLGDLPTGTMASSVVISRPGIDLTRSDVRAPWGNLKATGHFAFSHRGPSELRAAWSGVEFRAVRVVTSPAMPMFASRLTGTGTLRWMKTGLAALDFDASTRFDPTAGNELPLAGVAKVSARQGAWKVDHALTTANSVAMRGLVTIGVGTHPFVQSALGGQTHVTGPSLDSLVSVAHRLGVPEPGAFISTLRGPVAADVTLRGRFNDPTADADFVMPALVIDSVGQGTAQGHAFASRSSQGVHTADVTIAGSRVTATDIQHAENGALAGSIAVTSPNISPLIAWFSPAAATSITGAAHAQAELSGTTTAWQLAGHLDGTDVIAAGQRADRLSTDYTVRSDRVDFTSLDATAGSGQLQGGGWYGLDSGEQALDLTARNWPVTKCQPTMPTCVVAVPGAATISGRINTSGSIAHPTAQVQLTAVDASWGDARAGALEATVDARAGAGRFTFGAPDLHLSTEGTFTLDDHPRLDAVLHAREVDLADVLTRAGWPALAERIQGRVTGAASFAGNPRAPLDGAVTLDLEPATLTLTPVADQPKQLAVALDRAVHVEAARGRVAIQDLAAHVGAATVTGSGALDANDPHAQLNVRMDGPAKDLTDVASAVGFDKVAATAGQVSVAVSASGAPDAPRLTATASVEGGTLQVGTTAVTGVRARAALTPEGFNVEQAAAQWGDLTATASGKAPLKWLHGVLPWLAEASTAPTAAPATLTAHVAGDLGKLLAARMPRDTPTSGSLDATLDLSATSPRLDAVTGSLVRRAGVRGVWKLEDRTNGRRSDPHREWPRRARSLDAHGLPEQPRHLRIDGLRWRSAHARPADCRTSRPAAAPAPSRHARRRHDRQRPRGSRSRHGTARRWDRPPRQRRAAGRHTAAVVRQRQWRHLLHRGPGGRRRCHG